MGCELGRLSLVFSVILVVAGCASRTKTPTPRPASEPCSGQSVLVVENGSGYELEVYEARSGGGVGTILTTVGAGFHEVVVRREGGYYYFTRRARSNVTEASQSMRASASDRVTLRRECRSD